MAATVDTLKQITTLATGQTLYIIGQGLTFPSTVRFAIDQAGTNDLQLADATVDANGNAFIAQSSALAASWDIYVHDPNTNPDATRVAGPWTVVWVAGGVVPVYVSTTPALNVHPGSSEALLSWSPSVGIDARADTMQYDLQRSTTSAVAGFSNLATNLTATHYLDTTITNGTNYWYRVRAHVTYVSGLVGQGGTPGTPFPSAFSNVVAVSGVGEWWGSVVELHA